MDDLINAAQKTRPDKIEWRPLDSGRHVLDILQECGAVNARWSEILARREWVVWPFEAFLERRHRLTTLELAIQQLRQDTQLVVCQIETLADDELENRIAFPTYDATVAGCAMHPLGHMSYHEGQIGYIQTLYGDWS
jgi:hypothetical protein